MKPCNTLARAEPGTYVAERTNAFDWLLPALCTAHCLLALSTLLSPATFGPIGALMLTVFVAGLAATLRVPLHQPRVATAGPEPRAPAARYS